MTDSIESIIRRIVREEIRAALTPPAPPVTTPPDYTVLITPEELAEQLQVTVKAIYSLRSVGAASALPPALKIGKHLRWRQADVDAWMAAQT